MEEAKFEEDRAKRREEAEMRRNDRRKRMDVIRQKYRKYRKMCQFCEHFSWFYRDFCCYGLAPKNPYQVMDDESEM